MEILHSPRRGGKTTKLIEWLYAQQNRILVTFSDFEVRRLRELIDDEKVGKRIMSWREYATPDMAGYVNPNDFEVAVDNADMILHRYSRFPIKIISVTKD